MDENLPENGSPAVGILHVLDQALLRHLERITGTSWGIQGLPMDLMTVACIVLLTECSKAVAEGGDGGRWSRSGLEKELTEMGLDDPSMLEQTLRRMAEAGYLEKDGQQRMVPGKPTFSMARFLDHAFPGMPGMNLVAYFVQTLDEVETGRKDAADALRQLDQVLRRHGAVPFRRQGAGGKGPAQGASPASRPGSAPAPPRFKPSNRGGRPLRQKEKRPVFRSPGRTFPPADTGAGDMRTPGPLDRTAPPNEPSEPPSPPKERETAPAPFETEVKPEHALHATTGPETGRPGPKDEPETPLAEEASISPVAPTCELEGSGEETAPPDASSADRGEVFVEERIAAFEHKLAMECPVCRQASMNVRETSKGRVYYQCSSDQCMFISWGRPHHIPCPRCGNPFLVESTSGGGETLLKCPRATCRYTSRIGADATLDTVGSAEGGAPISEVRKKRRRVVKRRVVRRKR